MTLTLSRMIDYYWLLFISYNTECLRQQQSTRLQNWQWAEGKREQIESKFKLLSEMTSICFFHTFSELKHCQYYWTFFFCVYVFFLLVNPQHPVSMITHGSIGFDYVYCHEQTSHMFLLVDTQTILHDALYYTHSHATVSVQCKVCHNKGACFICVVCRRWSLYSFYFRKLIASHSFIQLAIGISLDKVRVYKKNYFNHSQIKNEKKKQFTNQQQNNRKSHFRNTIVVK